MERPRRLSSLFTRLGEAAKRLAGRVRGDKPTSEPPPAIIGLPPSAEGFTGRPTDPALHAEALAFEWADVVAGVFTQADARTGYHGRQDWRAAKGTEIQGAAFLPGERDGGGVTSDGINVDSGVLNPGLNAEAMGPEASALWAKARLRDRVDSVIATSTKERLTGNHDDAERRAAETKLPISEPARISGAIADHKAQPGR